MSDKQSKLLMPFIDESPAFTHGFECGQVWEQLRYGKKFKHYLFHSSNIEQMHSICEHFKCRYDIIPYNEDWSHLTVDVNPAGKESESTRMSREVDMQKEYTRGLWIGLIVGTVSVIGLVLIATYSLWKK